MARAGIRRSRAFCSPAASGLLEITRTISAATSPRSIAPWRARKFEPRPESRTATLAGDIVDPPSTGAHPADREAALLRAAQPRLDSLRGRRADDQHHPDAHVEHTEHLVPLHPAVALEQEEELGD